MIGQRVAQSKMWAPPMTLVNASLFQTGEQLLQQLPLVLILRIVKNQHQEVFLISNCTFCSHFSGINTTLNNKVHENRTILRYFSFFYCVSLYNLDFSVFFVTFIYIFYILNCALIINKHQLHRKQFYDCTRDILKCNNDFSHLQLVTTSSKINSTYYATQSCSEERVHSFHMIPAFVFDL